jgi:hypothetical protein
VPIKIKAAAAVSARDVAGLRQCMKDLKLDHGYVVYGGDEPRTIGTDIDVVSWSRVVRGEETFGLGRRSVGMVNDRKSPARSPARSRGGAPTRSDSLG